MTRRYAPIFVALAIASAAWAIVREATHVLQLIHTGEAAQDNAVSDIVAAYKRRFEQEAVLRVKANVCIAL